MGIVSYIDPYQADKTLKGKTLVKIDPRYYRPAEVDELQADITKAKQKLHWQPRVTFNELVRIMIDYDLQAVNEQSQADQQLAETHKQNAISKLSALGLSADEIAALGVK